MKIKIEDIVVEDRFREDFGDVEELAVSIQRYGLLHPITVEKLPNGKYKLIAGERRLRAHTLLGWKEIEARPVGDLNKLEKREIELEENIKRKNFTWAEEVKAKAEIDKIKRQLYGDAIKGYGGGWGIKQMAEALDQSVGTVHRDLKIAKALEKYPELEKEKNKEAAWKRYLKLEEEKTLKELADKITIKYDIKDVVKGDCTAELKKLKSESVDLVITDPPFGINLDMKSDSWTHIYAIPDEEQLILDKVELAMRECFRVLKPDTHLYLFIGINHLPRIVKMLEEIGFKVSPVPCVWVKSQGSMRKKCWYSSNFEIFVQAMKGYRDLNHPGKSNIFDDKQVAPQFKKHPTEKPTSLLRKIIEQSSQPGDLVIDPFAGSGSTLVAAIQTKRRFWGCELDDNYYNVIVERISQIQTKEKEGK